MVLFLGRCPKLFGSAFVLRFNLYTCQYYYIMHYLRLVISALLAVVLLASGGSLYAQNSANDGEELFLLLKDDGFIGKDNAQLRADRVKLIETVGENLTGFLAEQNEFVISFRMPKERVELEQILKQSYPEAEFSELTLEQLNPYWPTFRSTEKRNK